MARRKSLKQITAQADRLNEMNWARKNVWGSSKQSYAAKQSREKLIARAESRAIMQRGLSLSSG